MSETKTLVRPWTCESCGLKHAHFNDIDHNLRGVTLGPSSHLRDLEYNERCHCGWHELAHKIEQGEVSLPDSIEEYILEARDQLPIPENVKEEIKEL